MHPEIPSTREKPVTLIHHAANCGHNYPAGSLSALGKCLANGASFVEIDIIPLSDSSFALLHDPNLALDTTGSGNAPEMKREQIENLRYVNGGVLTDEKVGFLDSAVELFKKFPDTQRLQLDFKPFTPLSDAILRNLLALLAPVIDRVQVSSVADWAVRSLAKASPELSLGFDPLLYLDLVDDEPRPENIPPFRLGAYDLLDDHPLSVYKWGPAGQYFAARADALRHQVPQGCDWYIRAEILKMALDAGFNWIEFLHQHGSIVDGWTIDVTQPAQIDLAQYLVDHGVDALTTDHPSDLATHLTCKTII